MKAILKISDANDWTFCQWPNLLYMRVEQKDLESLDILVFGQTSGSIRERCQFFHYNRRAESPSRLLKLPIYLNKAFLGISAAALVDVKNSKVCSFQTTKIRAEIEVRSRIFRDHDSTPKRPYACHAASSQSLHPSSRYHVFQQPQFQTSRFRDLGPGLE